MGTLEILNQNVAGRDGAGFATAAIRFGVGACISAPGGAPAQAGHLQQRRCAGRLLSHISIDKRCDGQAKLAAIAAFTASEFIKHVMVVDKDIDVYDEEQVLWAVATHVDACENEDAFFPRASLPPTIRESPSEHMPIPPRRNTRENISERS